MKQNYEVEANKLAHAIDIAIETFRQFPPQNLEKHHIDHFINVYQEWKEMTLHPEPKFKTVTSLKYKIHDVFTYFQEAEGETVEQFWKRISLEKLKINFLKF